MANGTELLVEGLVNKLNLNSKSEEELKMDLDHILEQCTKQDLHEEYCDKLMDRGIIQLIRDGFKQYPKLAVKLANIIAELAKTESRRALCMDPDLIRSLISLLSCTDIKGITQACRALGNITYDNDKGRDLIDSLGVTSVLLDVLRSHCNAQQEGSQELRTVACGFLLNLSNTHGVQIASCDVERPFRSPRTGNNDGMRTITLNLGLDADSARQTIQDKLVSSGALEVLQQYLQLHLSDERVCNMAVLCIDILVETDSGRTRSRQCGLAVTAGRLLSQVSHSVDLQQLIVELLANLADTDEVKLQLAKSDILNILLDVIHRNQHIVDDEDCTTLLKLTSDLIVLILIEDESMSTLYNNGAGVIYKETCAWLSSPNEQLNLAGALAMGNFARGDDQCVLMVKEGIPTKLLDLLKPQNELSDNKEIVTITTPTLQHAVFSCLRNLAIPAENKSILLSPAQFDQVVLFIHSEMATVHFRLLGLFRMLCDGQKSTAIRFGASREFVEFVVKCSSNNEHAGVKGEATRLLSWIVKHSLGDKSVAKTILECQGLIHLIEMTKSEHLVMQNEALIALTLIVPAVIVDHESDFSANNLPGALKDILVDDQAIAEIQCNVLCVVNELVKSEKLKSELISNGVAKCVKDLTKHSEKMLKQQATAVNSLFG